MRTMLCVGVTDGAKRKVKGTGKECGEVDYRVVPHPDKLFLLITSDTRPLTRRRPRRGLHNGAKSSTSGPSWSIKRCVGPLSLAKGV